MPAEEVERRVLQAARELGRQMRIPGFRKGKVPPPVVIRRLGREAVLDEASAQCARPAGTPMRSTPPGSLPWASPSSTSASCPARASRWPSRSRSASVPEPSSASTRASRSGAGSPRWTTRGSTQELESLRERFGTLETVERAAASGDHLVIDYRGHDRRRAVRGRGGSRPAARAGLRAPDPGLRGAARGRRGRRAAHRRGRASPRSTRSSSPGEAASFEVTVKRGQGEAAARARRRVRLRVGRLRHAGRVARGHRHPAARGRRAHGRA